MTEEKKFGLNHQTHFLLKTIFEKHPAIEKAVLYGSRAKGNFKPGSDIDLALIAPSMTSKELSAVENEIDDLLLPYKVDLSLFHLIDNFELIEHIERVGQTFYPDA